MNEINYVLQNLNTDRRNYVGKFFTIGQYVRLSHWAKNAWFQILKLSLFGEISRNVAANILGHEMVGQCTIAICAEQNRSKLYIADKVGVYHINLAELSVFRLEWFAGLLQGKILPADTNPNDRTRARQELLQREISCLSEEHPDLYLAGL